MVTDLPSIGNIVAVSVKGDITVGVAFDVAVTVAVVAAVAVGSGVKVLVEGNSVATIGCTGI